MCAAKKILFQQMLMLSENHYCMLLVAKSLIEHLLAHSTVKKREVSFAANLNYFKTNHLSNQNQNRTLY